MLKKLWENKATRYAIISVGVLLLIGIAYYFLIYKPKKDKERVALLQKALEIAEEKGQENALNHIVDSLQASIDNNTSNFTGATEDIFPIEKGKSGPEIHSVQRILRNVFNENVPATGVWDDATIAAFKKHKNRDNITKSAWKKWGWDKMHDTHMSSLTQNE